MEWKKWMDKDRDNWWRKEGWEEEEEEEDDDSSDVPGTDLLWLPLITDNHHTYTLFLSSPSPDHFFFFSISSPLILNRITISRDHPLDYYSPHHHNHNHFYSLFAFRFLFTSPLSFTPLLLPFGLQILCFFTNAVTMNEFNCVKGMWSVACNFPLKMFEMIVADVNLPIIEWTRTDNLVRKMMEFFRFELNPSKCSICSSIVDSRSK